MKLRIYNPVLGRGIMILRSICLRASLVDPRLPFTDDLSLSSSYLPNYAELLDSRFSSDIELFRRLSLRWNAYYSVGLGILCFSLGLREWRFCLRACEDNSVGLEAANPND